MPTFDLHQHLWPEAFIAGLGRRTGAAAPRRIRSRAGRRARERARPRRPRPEGAARSPRPLRARRRRRLAPAHSRPRPGRATRTPSFSPHTTRASSSSRPPPADGSSRSRPARRSTALPAPASPRAGSEISTAWRRSWRSSARPAATCSCTRDRPRRPTGRERPTGGPQSSTTPRRCRRPTRRGSRTASSAGPTFRSCSRSSPAAAPFQLERLASRGVPGRELLHPNVYFDTASYGRRALDLCLATFGVDRVCFGSDTPVVEPLPTLDAVRSFGDAVTDALCNVNPSRILG